MCVLCALIPLVTTFIFHHKAKHYRRKDDMNIHSVPKETHIFHQVIYYMKNAFFPIDTVIGIWNNNYYTKIHLKLEFKPT